MNKLNKLIATSEYQHHLEKIKKVERQRKYCKHHWQHLLDVARIAYILLLESKDVSLEELKKRSDAKEIIYTAALLHDIGRWAQYDTGRCHAKASAEMAFLILQNSGFNEQDIDIICSAIGEHRKYHGFTSLLGEILSKADNYSRQCYYCSVKESCKKYKKLSWEIAPVVY
ncbi:HD superfamily phosphodiesterase [Desulfitispora alkaliphila]|uniref:HD domain-containing protein n=1 Tax=Desulfitispora alkaliphila TaxID=622674 RepID=UPI003D203165